MINYFSRLFYGMIIDDKEVSFIKEIFKEGKDVFTQDQFGMDIDMVYDFSAKTRFFIFITPSLQRIDGNGIQPIISQKESVLWDNILYNFCELYDVQYTQPHWFLTNEVWS